jgi:hypothetical protein
MGKPFSSRPKPGGAVAAPYRARVRPSEVARLIPPIKSTCSMALVMPSFPVTLSRLDSVVTGQERSAFRMAGRACRREELYRNQKALPGSK